MSRKLLPWTPIVIAGLVCAGCATEAVFREQDVEFRWANGKSEVDGVPGPSGRLRTEVDEESAARPYEVPEEVEASPEAPGPASFPSSMPEAMPRANDGVVTGELADEPRARLREAIKRIGDGEYAQAEVDLRTLEAEGDGAILDEVRFWLGYCLEKAGRDEQAIATYEDAAADSEFGRRARRRAQALRERRESSSPSTE